LTKPSDGDNGVAGAGIEHQKCTVIQVVYNHATNVVTLGMVETTIGLAQMMIHEAGVQLDLMRRQAATVQMLQERASATQTQQILEDLRKRR